MNSRYSAVAIALHWAIAFLILGNLLLGWWMHEAIDDPAQRSLAINGFQLHKSLGLSILLLSLLRLGWRLSHRPPPLPEGMRPWERALAGLTHWGFYGLMLALPLSGWVLVSTQWRGEAPLTIPTLWFGLFEVPHLFGLAQASVELRQQVAAAALSVHELLVWGLCLLLAGHVAAAFKHQFLARDGLMQRMQPRPLALLGLLLILLPALAASGWMLWGKAAPQQVATEGIRSVPGAWVLDAQRSHIHFAGEHAGEAFEGHFADWEADIRIDPEDLSASSIQVQIETASASDGVPLHDSTLPEAEWFNVEQYPQSVFRSTAIRVVGEGQAVVDGVLRIKDRDLPVQSLQLRWDGQEAQIQGQVEIDRAAADLGMESDPEGDWVSRRIQVEVLATVQPPG